MRIVILKGKTLRMMKCPGCGQVEKQTEDESDLCLNCGTKMEAVRDVPQLPTEPVAETPESPAAAKEKSAPVPYTGKKRGPKKKGCQTCAKALATVNDKYTCKESMTLKNPEDICGKWLKGVPVGEKG